MPGGNTSRTVRSAHQTLAPPSVQPPTHATIAVRRAHLDPLLRPGDLQCAPRLEPASLPSHGTAAHPLAHADARACADFDALYAYLTCGNYDFNYDRSKNLRPKRNIRTAMNNEIMLYGIAQKVRGGAGTNHVQPHP